MKKWILNNLISNGKLISKRCKSEWFDKNGLIDKYNEILSLTNFLKSASMPQRCWHIVNGHNKVVKCKNPRCNNVPKFLTYTNGYLNTCSNVCAQLNPETINKIKSTNLDKYGSEYGLSNKEVISKRKKTCLINYGVDNPTKSKVILNKIKDSNIKKHGVDWILRDQIKKENAVYSKYGVKNIQQSIEIKQKTTITRRSNFYDTLFTSERLNNKVKPLFDKESYINGGYYENYEFECLTCGTKFFDCLEDGDIPRCTTCYKGSSIFEKEVVEFISGLYKDEILFNDRNVLNGMELDIYIPKLNLAIECDGLFWHGELNGGKNKQYHLSKTEECKKLGINLIHIFEDEWLFKKEIVKGRLNNLFISEDINKIYARKCVVKKISSKESNLFLKENHLQGRDNSFIKLGLFYDDKLVSVMTFGKLRVSLGNGKSINNVYEIYRFCSKVGNSVIGAASKLLKHFVDVYKPAKIITYADRRWGSGKLYENIGFKCVSVTSPSYWYFGKGNSYKRHHRFSYAKHRLSKKLKSYNPDMTEWENMKNNGYDRIWDCGNYRYEFNFS